MRSGGALTKKMLFNDGCIWKFHSKHEVLQVGLSSINKAESQCH